MRAVCATREKEQSHCFAMLRKIADVYAGFGIVQFINTHSSAEIGSATVIACSNVQSYIFDETDSASSVSKKLPSIVIDFHLASPAITGRSKPARKSDPPCWQDLMLPVKAIEYLTYLLIFFYTFTQMPSLSFLIPSRLDMIFPTVLLLTLRNLVLNAIDNSSVNKIDPGLQLCTISSRYSLVLAFLLHFAFFMLLSCCHYSISCCNTHIPQYSS